MVLVITLISLLILDVDSIEDLITYFGFSSIIDLPGNYHGFYSALRGFIFLILEYMVLIRARY